MTRHNHSRRGRRSPEYLTWCRMKDRCYNPNHDKYAHYGGRGIRVCLRWHTFKNFYADMGPRPEGCSLDREDGNKGYGPSNCRWANLSVQNQNRRPFGKGSKYRGVSWDASAKRWQVRICVNKHTTYVGRFKDELEAAKAYDEAALKLIGEEAATNFPHTKSNKTRIKRKIA